MDRKTATGKIRALAERTGFSLVGFARAEGLQPEGELLREWLARGFHGKMSWMEREPSKRCDPREMMPGAKSVISLALNYFTDHKHPEDPNRGKVSRYAWGDDYHDIVKEKLRELLDEIRLQIPGAEGRVFVDTAPMLEKAWAVRAGLGWIGKHTNLITKEFGSWIFLGEIVLNIELEYTDRRVEDHCGTCTACIDACPTSAITEPYVVDSRKCISYATIELRDEELPDEVAEKLEGWLYGCDICQDVCPWNRFEEDSRNSAFEPRPGNIAPPLDRIAKMTRDEYVERFRGSAMKRTKISGLKRNARALIDAAAAED